MNKDWSIARANEEIARFAEPLPLIERIDSFEAVVAAWGVPDEAGRVIAKQAAITALNQLQLGATREINGYPWTITSKRIDTECGCCYATFERKPLHNP